jgi:hypothetical protein
MKRLTLVAIFAGLIAAGSTASASGDGAPGPAPGVTNGWEGVLAPGGNVRYVAIVNGRSTLVQAVQVRGGRVLRWRTMSGQFGSPLIAFDGTAGGVSADGRTLVLASFPSYRAVKSASPAPSQVSRFPVLSTRNLARRATVTLRGTWAYDALSPDGSTIFLIEYSGTGPNASYRVRAYDVPAGRLVPGAIVDGRVGEKLMRGQPVTRATSLDGRWEYTLYARAKQEPFVHALDTVERKALCIDLPLDFAQERQMQLRLRLRGGNLQIREARSTVAVVDTERYTVRTLIER